MKKSVRIPVGPEESLLLKFDVFDDEEGIDMDRLLKIDPSNIPMEVATFTIILNRIAMLLVEADYAVNICKLEVETLSAQLAEKFRNEFFEKEGKQLSNEKCDEAISRDAKYKLKKQIYFKRVKEQSYLSSLYWSCKSKDEKINKLIMSVQIGDIEEALINSKLKKFNYLDLKILKTSNGF